MRIDLPSPKKFHHIFEQTLGKSLSKKVSGITTDSRDVHENDLYIAISGENVDGHSFLPEVYKKGACAALVNKANHSLELEQLEVENTIKSIGTVANCWRNQFHIPIIGITGSNGKTSTKELLKHILSSKYDVHATEGNYNTSIGLPLTILKLSEYHGASILEMGANQPGDIELLCKIADPNYGLITNIAPAHLEGFGNIDNIAKTKGALFEHLSDGTSFVNIADHRIKNIKASGKIVTYGLTSNCDYPADLHHNDEGSIVLTIDSKEVETKSANLSFAKNVLACSAIACELDINWEAIKERIMTFKAPKGRCEIKSNGKITIIDDTYNANIESTLAAIDYLKAFSGNENKIFIFGDMLELGDHSEKQHRKIGKKCNEAKLYAVLTIGNETIATNDEINQSTIHKHFDDKNDLISYFNEICNENDKILVKGSRGMHMEEIVNSILG